MTERDVRSRPGFLWKLLAACGFAFAHGAGSASALPVLAIDVAPGTPGIQASGAVAVGQSFAVQVLISDVGAGDPLNAFELQLVLEPGKLSASSAQSGDFLAAPVMVLTNSITLSGLEFAAATLGSAGATGSGILLEATLHADQAGFAELSLSDIVLSAPFGQQISLGRAQGALLLITPEPSLGLLLALLAVATGWRRNR